jgi:hypothetical protein
MMFIESVRPVSGQSKGVDVGQPTRMQRSIEMTKLMIWVYFSRSEIESITA